MATVIRFGAGCACNLYDSRAVTTEGDGGLGRGELRGVSRVCEAKVTIQEFSFFVAQNLV